MSPRFTFHSAVGGTRRAMSETVPLDNTTFVVVLLRNLLKLCQNDAAVDQRRYGAVQPYHRPGSPSGPELTEERGRCRRHGKGYAKRQTQVRMTVSAVSIRRREPKPALPTPATLILSQVTRENE